MTIRVVSIISRMNVGGPAVLLKELIENLPQAEFEHILITGRCHSNEIDYLEENPIQSRVIYIDSLKRSMLPTRDFVSFFRLIFLLKKLQPDIVHTHTSKAGALGRLAAKISSRRIRIIHTFHGHVLYGYFSPLKTALVVLIERALGHITDDAIAITRPVKEELLAARIGSHCNWHVIHPAVKDVNDHPTRQEEKAKMKIGWVGRFTQIKNPMLAIQAFEVLCFRRDLNLEMIMVGGGELLESCKDYAEYRNIPISFTGWKTNIQMHLIQLDLLLLTSINEGLGLVILEAGLLEIPTLSTNVGGVSDIIENNITGYLSELNLDKYAQRLIDLVENPSELKKVGQRARKKVLDEFSQRDYLQKHKDLYKMSIRA